MQPMMSTMLYWLSGVLRQRQSASRPKCAMLDHQATLSLYQGQRKQSWQTKLGSELSVQPLHQAGVAGALAPMCQHYKRCLPMN